MNLVQVKIGVWFSTYVRKLGASQMGKTDYSSKDWEELAIAFKKIKVKVTSIITDRIEK